MGHAAPSGESRKIKFKEKRWNHENISDFQTFM